MKGSGYALEQVKGEAKGSQRKRAFSSSTCVHFGLPFLFVCRVFAGEFLYEFLPGGIEMMDVIYIAVTLVFFGISAAYVRACDKL